MGIPRHTGTGAPVNLTAREAALLCALVEDEGAPVPARKLLEDAWGWDNADQLRTKTVAMHVSRLRGKIEMMGGDPGCIATVRRKGYLYDGRADSGGVAAAAAKAERRRQARAS